MNKTFKIKTEFLGAFDTNGSTFQGIFGSKNTFIGYNAGYTGGITGSNNTCLGANAMLSGLTASNEIVLGDSSIATLRCQVNTITGLSDRRDKKDIQKLNAGITFITQLNPVSFTWNTRDGGKVDIPDTGFIAQDLKQVQIDTGVHIPGLVFEANPDKMEASYGKLLPVLVEAIQDLKREMDVLRKDVADLKKNT